MSELERIKEAIFALKKAKVITKNEDISEKTGYHTSSVSEILNEKVPLSDKFIRIFCSAFGINLDYIKGNSKEMFNTYRNATRSILINETEASYHNENSILKKENSEMAKRIAELEERIAELKDMVDLLKKSNELITNKQKDTGTLSNKQTT